jgi:hypothetical protein
VRMIPIPSRILVAFGSEGGHRAANPDPVIHRSTYFNRMYGGYL